MYPAVACPPAMVTVTFLSLNVFLNHGGVVKHPIAVGATLQTINCDYMTCQGAHTILIWTTQ